jgi:rhodanese-related sulfurtransferase
MSIIEEIFPKDKVIFLMCGGGGYAGMTKNFLVSLGWDENKIYNTGGYWFYKGEHSINVKKEIDGKVTYDFESVPYHNIDFESLTKNEDLITPDAQVSDLKINTTQLDLEVKNTFKLNVIVLPNEASNKELKWTSSNEEIAQVSNEGVVKALKEGEVTIKATSVDGNKEVSCNVKVSKKDNGNLIELDDVSAEATELAQYDLTKISRDFYAIVDDKSGKTKPEYLGKDGKINDLWREEYNKYQANLADANTKRIEIFNKVVDAQKSFIVLIEGTECDSSYEVSEEAARILKEHNYSYIVVSMPTGAGNGDKTFFESRLDTTDYKGGAMAVVKEGKLYASTDPNTDSIKSEEDIINWLSKYIIIS